MPATHAANAPQVVLALPCCRCMACDFGNLLVVTCASNTADGFQALQDSLAEGMHLIDFEQLKMENVTLREKIEERGDEVARLRRKTNATVQAHPSLALHSNAVCAALNIALVMQR